MAGVVVKTVLCWMISVNIILAYEWGSEESACNTMMPVLESEPMELEEYYYRISPNKDTFYPGEKLYIRIKGKTSEDRYTYRGAILTVLQAEPVGEWGEFHPTKYARIACGGKNNTGIIEFSNLPKVVGDDVFIWQAPSECKEDNRFYDLTGTIVKSKDEILQGLTTLIRCVPSPNDGQVEDLPEDACAAEYVRLPSFNETSFETNYGGWWNAPMSGMRWSRHSGRTKSPSTGPIGTLEGKWYIYTEASYPAQRGDTASLYSPIGISGCFCFRLKYHMNVSKQTTFSIVINGEVALSRHNSSEKWNEAHVSVNQAKEVMIELKVVRGIDFRGDVAVDSISFTPGICEEDGAKEI